MRTGKAMPPDPESAEAGSIRPLVAPMNPCLVFDIETIPDVAGLRRLHDLSPSLSDAEVAVAAQTLRRQTTGSDFLPHCLQRVVAISCALRAGAKLAVWSLGEPDDGEADLISRFFELFDRYTPQVVSWNGGGFDFPVLHYRSLIHGVAAPRYWEWGDEDRDFRYNNYLNRYHTRHIDLMDVLAQFQARAYAPLDAMAKLCGLPGKLGMDGSQVWDAYQRGEIAAIRAYCETDVVNTYLLYLRFMQLRGVLNAAAYAEEVALTRKRLGELPERPWGEYLREWAAGAP
jgi:predicted PolB exonuclease-like 3'-5' exonuclease